MSLMSATERRVFIQALLRFSDDPRHRDLRHMLIRAAEEIAEQWAHALDARMFANFPKWPPPGASTE